MLECRELHYNWRQVGPLQADQGFEVDVYKVGVDGVVKIFNMTPTEPYSGPEFYDVKYEDGRTTTVYNPNEAFYVEVVRN